MAKESLEELYRRLDAIDGLMAEKSLSDGTKTKLTIKKEEIEQELERDYGSALRITPKQDLDSIRRAIENNAPWKNKRFWKQFNDHFLRQSDPAKAAKYYKKQIKKLKDEGRALIKSVKAGDIQAKERIEVLANQIRFLMKQYDSKGFMKYLRSKKRMKPEDIIDQAETMTENIMCEALKLVSP